MGSEDRETPIKKSDENKISDGDDDHKCPVCETSFASENNMKIHAANSHQFISSIDNFVKGSSYRSKSRKGIPRRAASPGIVIRSPEAERKMESDDNDTLSLTDDNDVVKGKQKVVNDAYAKHVKCGKGVLRRAAAPGVREMEPDDKDTYYLTEDNDLQGTVFMKAESDDDDSTDTGSDKSYDVKGKQKVTDQEPEELTDSSSSEEIDQVPVPPITIRKFICIVCAGKFPTRLALIEHTEHHRDTGNILHKKELPQCKDDCSCLVCAMNHKKHQ